MQLDTDVYMTASEAARLLGVSRQRVDALIDDGVLDVQRPWPMVTLVRVTEVEERLKGGRPLPVGKRAFRRWMIDTYEIDPATEDRAETEDLALVFTTNRRPGWETERREMWALGLAAATYEYGSGHE